MSNDIENHVAMGDPEDNRSFAEPSEDQGFSEGTEAMLQRMHEKVSLEEAQQIFKDIEIDEAIRRRERAAQAVRERNERNKELDDVIVEIGSFQL